MIIAVFEHPDTGEYIDASPYQVYSSFKYQGLKVHAGFSEVEGRYRVTMRVDKKREAPVFVSFSRFLSCIDGNFIEHDGKIYLMMATIQIFLDEFARCYVVRKFNLPYQLELPLYQPLIGGDISHPSLTVLD